MALPAKKERHTVQEYFQLERTSLDKHEFHNGEIFALADGTRAHSLITTNVIACLANALKKKTCHVYDSNLRIRIAGTQFYTYPDVSVICGPANSDGDDPFGESFTNPTLIVEVLSPSTESYDRGEKFKNYLRINSLLEYVLVAQTSARVETYFRQPESNWLFRPYSDIAATAKLRSLEIDLPLIEVYAGVEFPPSIDSTPSTP